MAFVSRSERFNSNPQSTSVGPGAYISHNEYTSNISYAPFSSTAERQSFASQASKPIPGPGSYIPIESKGLSSSDFDHWGQPKNSSAFASQNERFTQKINQTPGPGSYVQEDKWKKLNNLAKSEACLTISKIPNTRSIPSIPSNIHSLGYEENEQGELVVNKNSLIHHTGRKEDSAGPGHYTLNQLRDNKGTTWHKSKSQRDFYRSNTATGPSVGPGAYTKFKVKVEPMYKFKESSAFACKTSRTNTISTTSPGPGSYDTVKNTFKQKKLPNSLQNFGSSSSRFLFKLNEDSVGPGHYHMQSSNTVNINPKAPFSSSNSRFNYKNNSNPPPGAYSTQDLIDVIEKKNLNLQGAFGSTEKRFEYKNEQTPGPGHYRNDMKKKSKKPNAVFSSKVARNNFERKEGNPPPGLYEVHSAFENKKPPPAGIHKMVSKNIRNPYESQVAFYSSTERFDNNAKEKAPGPGSYDYALKGGEKKIMVFNEDRFKYKQNAIPGPTDYFEEANDNWNRKSYNVLFSESGVN